MTHQVVGDAAVLPALPAQIPHDVPLDIQPGAASAAQAVNQLSPPALASLGIFSRLASERAMGRLIEKAHFFFRTDAVVSPSREIDARDNTVRS